MRRRPNVTKVLLVGTEPDHPHGMHAYMFECQMLAKCLRQTSGVDAQVTLNWPSDQRLLQGVHAIVFYTRPAGEIVLAPNHRDSFLQLMSQGVGYVAIHWATGVGYSPLADADELRAAYSGVLGGWFRRPPGDVLVTETEITQIRTDHPLCRGWTGFALRDEIYLNPVIHPRATPLLSVRISQQDQVVAWARQRPRSRGGRSLGVTLGHFHENFAREDFRRLLVNGILWSAHRDIPTQGAPVKVTDQDLQLPALMIA